MPSLVPVEKPDDQIDQPTHLQCLLCREIFNKRRTPTDWADAWQRAEGELDEDGIGELSRVAEATLDDERGRGRQLDSKTTTLAGFSGLILSIDAALAGSTFGVDLGGVGNPVARVAFILSAVSMLVAVTIAIGGVLMPQKYRATGIESIDEFSSPHLQMRTRTDTHRAMLQTITRTLIQERSVNDCKARLCKGVATFQLIGFVALAIVSITLAQHSLF